MKFHLKQLTLALIFLITPSSLRAEHVPVRDSNLFLVYDCAYSGMFAEFSAILGALQFYENSVYAGIKVDLHSGYYFDPEIGPNWWEYFFEPINIGSEENTPHYHFGLEDHLFFADRGFHMPRHEAYRLIQKYIHVKPHILEKVDAFCQAHFADHYVIGVHHRGTDKVTEMPLVSYEKTCKILRTVITGLSREQKSKLRIYVATDDAHFITHMNNLFPNIVIYNDFVRATDERALHTVNDGRYQSIYQKGEEALLDCLLLSRCNYLIRPWSSLSIIADHMNPDMPVIGIWGEK